MKSVNISKNQFAVLCLGLLFFIGRIVSADAQDISYYTDHLGYFKVFENGEINQVEHLPVKNIVMGGDYLFYEDDLENLVYYSKGEKERVSSNYPSKLVANRNFAITSLGGGTNVFYKGKLKNLALDRDPILDYSDSLIAFISHDQYLNIFKDGFEIEIEGPFDQKLTRSPYFKISNNSLAYLDLGGRIQLVFKNETFEIDNVETPDFWVGSNLVAYLDQYNEFQIYDKESRMPLEEYPPNQVFVSNNFVAYLDDVNEFKIYYSGLVEEIDVNKVDIIDVKDDIMVWTDTNGYFYYWQDGETILLENYAPNKVQIDLNHIVYTDYDGRLKGVYDGKKVEYTDEIVENFDLNGNVLRYQPNRRDTKFYWKGKTY